MLKNSVRFAIATAAIYGGFANAESSTSWADDIYLLGHAGYADSDVSQSDMEGEFADIGFEANVLSTDGGRTGWGLGLGYQIDEYWSLELDYLDLGEVDVVSTSEQVVSALGDIHPESGDGFTLSGLVRYPLNDRWHLRARLGLFSWDADYDTKRAGKKVADDSDSGTDLYIGVGAGYQISDRFGLNVEVQRFAFDREETIYTRLGFEWAFGVGKKTAAPLPAPKPAPMPAAIEVAPAQAENKPAPAVVVSQEQVCKLFEGSLEGINFEFSSAELTSEAKATLSGTAISLRAYSYLEVEVHAHTDWKGKGPANLLLSEQRAQSVMEYFIEQGIDANRLSSKGFGEMIPVADNRTGEGRAKNRRVELKSVGKASCK